MLNTIIRASLQHPFLTIAIALLVSFLGTWRATEMSLDVFPDFNRPRVVVTTEAPSLSADEIETLITVPLETAINGANGVQAVRSQSGLGISIIYVEFDWGTDIHIDRQVVTERIQLAQEKLPEGVIPRLAPTSSIMGQILMLSVYSVDGTTSPIDLRTHSDWIIQPRLLSIPGVSQIYTMGGGRKQFQVLVNPESMVEFGVSMEEIHHAVSESNANASGGFLDALGPTEILVRSIGRLESIEDLEKIVVKIRNGRPVSLAQVARVIEGPQVKRGDSSAFVREGSEGMTGGPSVLMTINKQPGADTRRVTQEILLTIEGLAEKLPEDVRIVPVYSQMSFIDRAIENVITALRDGSVLVVIFLFLFLMNLRTTIISLTAIPLSLVITAIIFAATGMSINTMTLGGLAVAIGELVDDAIVDVENCFRRLRENRISPNPRHPLQVIYEASVEIRNSIVFGTIIVIIVFIPLFYLSGIEGRLFAPLGFAYIISILASLVVSLTVTPVLCYLLLGETKPGTHVSEGLLLRALKKVGGGVIRLSLAFPRTILALVLLCVLTAGIFVLRMEHDFLPPFNEGAIQLNVILPPGTSLASSIEINRQVEERLIQIEDIRTISRRTGRAELDEHADGVENSEYILEIATESTRKRADLIAEIRATMEEFPWLVSSVEQPLSHLISHMVSGVKAQVAIKIVGDDLDILRNAAHEMRKEIASVPGVQDLYVEPQVSVPQLRLELDREALLRNGVHAADANWLIETALNGVTTSQIIQGQRSFDLVLRLDDPYRNRIDVLRRLAIPLHNGGSIPLEEVARFHDSVGPNFVNRENVRRRIVLQCNISNRGLVEAVQEIRSRLAPLSEKLPTGYYVEYGGQFESQQSASRMMAILFGISVLGVFFTLYAMFHSVNLSLQVMAALPMAFIGAVVALVVTGQTLSIACMVGFISLGGIASRNGILLLNHYLHLVRYEGEQLDQKMIVRAGIERLAPVLMTALTSGIGLVPLVLAPDEPGKEILYPIATVIVGGLISSTLLDFLVHPALFLLFGLSAVKKLQEKSLIPTLDPAGSSITTVIKES